MPAVHPMNGVYGLLLFTWFAYRQSGQLDASKLYMPHPWKRTWLAAIAALGLTPPMVEAILDRSRGRAALYAIGLLLPYLSTRLVRTSHTTDALLSPHLCDASVAHGLADLPTLTRLPLLWCRTRRIQTCDAHTCSRPLWRGRPRPRDASSHQNCHVCNQRRHCDGRVSTLSELVAHSCGYLPSARSLKAQRSTKLRALRTHQIRILVSAILRSRAGAGILLVFAWEAQGWWVQSHRDSVFRGGVCEFILPHRSTSHDTVSGPIIQLNRRLTNLNKSRAPRGAVSLHSPLSIYLRRRARPRPPPPRELDRSFTTTEYLWEYRTAARTRRTA